ncbi:MAG: Heme A synthase [Phycisphaerae bacterium]|nr:Heme A synthase [Phycisphaerae bacterium]
MNSTMPRSMTANGSTRVVDLLAIGSGSTVTMWITGYLCRLSPGLVPSAVVLLLLVLILVAGGFVTGYFTPRGWLGGAWVGVVSGLLNLLILGSLLSGDQPNQLRPVALVWLPGSLLVSALLGAVGAAIGQLLAVSMAARRATARNWIQAWVVVAAVATYALLFIGGLVTSHDAGLAVVDWPNSFGYNMFLYPLSRMTGGIYFEHAHRLFGSLVGLTTLLLAIYVQSKDERRWVRRWMWWAFVVVCIQGVLGGLRVTGRFTLSTSVEDVAPSITLAIVHGVLGQLFFGMIMAVVAFMGTRWRQGEVQELPSAGTDRPLSLLLIGLLIVQLVFGAIVRHVAGGVMIHISMAVVVLLVAVVTGLRAWGLHEPGSLFNRLGRWLLGLISLQLLLGLAALIAVGLTPAVGERPLYEVIIATSHQACGAALLGLSVLLAAWYHRLTRAPKLTPQTAPSISS